MNPELEQLVEYALIDGYITDKERQVLINKAKKLGYDIDELEMILDGKLSKLNIERQEASPLKKCPNCGEVLTGLNKVCDACDYVIDGISNSDETLEESLDEIRGLLNELKHYQPKVKDYIGNVIIWIIFTGGLHLVYRVIKGGPLFVEENEEYKELLSDIDNRLAKVISRYGKNADVKALLDKFAAEKQYLVKERRMKGLKKGLMWSVIIGAGFIYTVHAIVNAYNAPPSAEKLVERYIREKNIGRAKAFVPKVEDAHERSQFNESIQELVMDSLIYEAKDYDAALAIVNLEPSVVDRDMKIDEILSIEINELLKNKEYKRARERASMVDDTYMRDKFIEKITLAEKLEK